MTELGRPMPRAHYEEMVKGDTEVFRGFDANGNGFIGARIVGLSTDLIIGLTKVQRCNLILQACAVELVSIEEADQREAELELVGEHSDPRETSRSSQDG